MSEFILNSTKATRNITTSYEEVIYHRILNVNIVDNFQHRDWMEAGYNNTTSLSYLTYLSIVYFESVRISLTIYVLIILNLPSCYI